MRYLLCLTTFAGLTFGQQTLTCTFRFTGSGTVGATAFTNAAITMTTVGNTSNLYVTPGGNPRISESFIRNDSASITIAGVGAFQFSSPIQVSNVPDNDSDTDTNILLTDINGNAFLEAFDDQSEWQMLTSFGPLTFSGFLTPSSVPQAITNGGTLTLKVAVLPVVFQAAIATPAQPYTAIAAVTNAAIPGVDIPAPFYSLPLFPTSIHLAPRSMATIYGTNLAGNTASSTSPWSTTLGGTEVHLVSDTCSDPSCELSASLIYVSPTQINFLVPDDGEAWYAVPTGYRIVFVQNGQRIDNRYSQGSPGYPGYLYIDSFYLADYNVIFQVGYDCLFSYSLSDPAACGLSWSSGTNRGPLGAITDAIDGRLISSANPVHQGQSLTLWTTGFQGGATLSSSGLLTANTFPVIGFGVSQLGKIIAAGFMSPAPSWAGESPQFVGLDQVNVTFPTCVNTSVATTEERYEAFLVFINPVSNNGTNLYIPFDVRPGDPDCSNITSNENMNRKSTSLAGSMSPASYVSGQPVTLTVNVSPSSGPTGVVTFVDTTTDLFPVVLGSATLNSAAQATLSTTLACSSAGVCARTIAITYEGDGNYASSTGQIAVSGQTAGSVP